MNFYKKTTIALLISGLCVTTCFAEAATSAGTVTTQNKSVKFSNDVKVVLNAQSEGTPDAEEIVQMNSNEFLENIIKNDINSVQIQINSINNDLAEADSSPELYSESQINKMKQNLTNYQSTKQSLQDVLNTGTITTENLTAVENALINNVKASYQSKNLLEMSPEEAFNYHAWLSQSNLFNSTSFEKAMQYVGLSNPNSETFKAFQALYEQAPQYTIQQNSELANAVANQEALTQQIASDTTLLNKIGESEISFGGKTIQSDLLNTDLINVESALNSNNPSKAQDYLDTFNSKMTPEDFVTQAKSALQNVTLDGKQYNYLDIQNTINSDKAELAKAEVTINAADPDTLETVTKAVQLDAISNINANIADATENLPAAANNNTPFDDADEALSKISQIVQLAQQGLPQNLSMDSDASDVATAYGEAQDLNVVANDLNTFKTNVAELKVEKDGQGLLSKLFDSFKENVLSKFSALQGKLSPTINQRIQSTTEDLNNYAKKIDNFSITDGSGAGGAPKPPKTVFDGGGDGSIIIPKAPGSGGGVDPDPTPDPTPIDGDDF